jgi:hypothetical protein
LEIPFTRRVTKFAHFEPAFRPAGKKDDISGRGQVSRNQSPPRSTLFGLGHGTDLVPVLEVDESDAQIESLFTVVEKYRTFAHNCGVHLRIIETDSGRFPK